MLWEQAVLLTSDGGPTGGRAHSKPALMGIGNSPESEVVKPPAETRTSSTCRTSGEYPWYSSLGILTSTRSGFPSWTRTRQAGRWIYAPSAYPEITRQDACLRWKLSDVEPPGSNAFAPVSFCYASEMAPARRTGTWSFSRRRSTASC